MLNGWLSASKWGQSEVVLEVLRRVAMCECVSKPDRTYDNAFMKSCVGTPNTERGMIEFPIQRAAFTAIGDSVPHNNL